MKAVLLGGAGFVGRNLTRVMINEGFKPENITVIDKNERNMELLENYRVKKILADLAEKGDWYNTFNGKELVINLAAQIPSPNPDLLYRNNVLTTKNVLEAAKNAGVKKIIHFSSAAVLSIRKDDGSTNHGDLYG